MLNKLNYPRKNTVKQLFINVLEKFNFYSIFNDIYPYYMINNQLILTNPS